MLINKDKAIAEDDFDRAVALRNGIEYIRDKAREYRNWLQLKQVAIDHEDYEVAKRYKSKIDNERHMIKEGYGVDTETGKMFEKSRDYKSIQIDPVTARRNMDLEQTVE